MAAGETTEIIVVEDAAELTTESLSTVLSRGIDLPAPPPEQLGPLESFGYYLTKTVLFDQPLWNWLLFAAVCVGLYMLFGIFVRMLQRRFKKQDEATPAADVAPGLAHTMFKSVKTFGLMALAVWLAVYIVDLGAVFGRVLGSLAMLLVFVQVALMITAVMDKAINHVLKATHLSESSAQTAFGIVRFFALIVLWSFVMLLALDNFGIEIAPLIAGLGIGGIAIAFALQQILGDVFCSVAIVLDRPFEVGDFIIAGDHMGTVERIGIKTTRVRSLEGEQIIFPNSDLIGSRVRNYKRMQQRRVAFTIGVLYSTPPEKLAGIPKMMKEIVLCQPRTRFDRAHLLKLGESSLDFEVVYFVLSSDFNVYADIQQQIILAMLRQFGEQGIGFAFPSRTLYTESEQFPLHAAIRDRQQDGGNGAPSGHGNGSLFPKAPASNPVSRKD